MCQNLEIYVLSVVLFLASGGETRTREKVRGLTKDGATEFALQKGVNDCGMDSDTTLCGTSPLTWVMSEECKKNPVVKQSCSFSCSPSGQLQEAAWRGSLAGVEQALAAGANPLCQKTMSNDNYYYYASKYQNRTAINFAALANQQWIVKKLLSIGVDVNLQTTEGITPTIDASHNGSTDVLKILIEHNANVNLPDADGLTPLMEAAWWGRLSATKALINANASIDVTGGSREGTALFWAVWHIQEDTALLLIEHNANVDLPGRHGQTPLMTAAWQGHLSGSKSVAVALVNANVSLDVTGGLENATALYYAADGNNQDIALLLLQNGADPMIPDYRGFTPAATARRMGHNELAAVIDSYTTTGAQDGINASYSTARTG